MKHNLDQILDLWHAGEPSGIIAAIGATMDELEKANADLQNALVDQMHADCLLASANTRVIECRQRVHDAFRKRAEETDRRLRKNTNQFRDR